MLLVVYSSYIWMPVHMHTQRWYARIDGTMHYAHTFTHAHPHPHPHIHLHTHKNTYTATHTLTYLQAPTHVHTYTHRHTHTRSWHSFNWGPQDAWSSGSQLMSCNKLVSSYRSKSIAPCTHLIPLYPSCGRIFAYQNFGCQATAAHTHTHTHMHTCTHPHTHALTPVHAWICYMTLIGVYEMHGQEGPN